MAWYFLVLRKRQDYRNSKKVSNHDEGDPPQRVKLHGFCDTSQQSYGACIYLKSTFKGGKVSVHLIASKSRLAPIKETTIPKAWCKGGSSSKFEKGDLHNNISSLFHLLCSRQT